jgi:hypothetical protein
MTISMSNVNLASVTDKCAMISVRNILSSFALIISHLSQILHPCCTPQPATAWWIPPIIGVVELGLMRPVRGFNMIVKCRGYVSRWPGVCGMRRCSKTVVGQCSHMTSSSFAKRTLCGQGVRVGAKQEVSRHVAYAWGVVPCPLNGMTCSLYSFIVLYWSCSSCGGGGVLSGMGVGGWYQAAGESLCSNGLSSYCDVTFLGGSSGTPYACGVGLESSMGGGWVPTSPHFGAVAAPGVLFYPWLCPPAPAGIPP